MCCYSQFARTLCFQSHQKTIYIFINQRFNTIKYAFTLTLINKKRGNKFILWQ
ncbi:hypothetical protein T636_A3969 [Enterobacter hormaechei subsp. xiangfangensis]|nr:hypothetical protein T636_A3969 [Enterobacter hormaechei subsp. xiangfangensis]